MTSARIDLIHELVSSAAADVPGRAAVIGADGAKVTFAEFDRQVESVAAWVGERTKRGDRVAVIADNSASYARLYYGVPRSGRILTLVNQRLSAAEQIGQLSAAEPRLLLGDARYLDALPAVARETPAVREVVTFDDPSWHRAVHEPASSSEPVDPDDPAWLLFTSGSTGPPKGVLHTNRSVTTAVRGTVAGRSVRPGGVYLLPFPMCHVAGYNMLVHHHARSTVLPVASFRADEFAAAVLAHGVTSCSLAPTMLHSLLAHMAATETQLPTLRDVSYGSAAIPADLLRRALDRLDADFHQGYGMTETGGNVTFLGPAEHRAGVDADPSILASAGRPHDEAEVRIAGTGPVGEIMIRGRQVAAAYWPSLEPVTVDGWLPTGDVGRVDAEGRLVVVDRIKDVVITGGENVSSREVEDMLSAHPDVDQVAVVGVADEYWGEAICAVVVVRAGSAPTADDLVTHVRANLTAFKRPRHVLFVAALPLTSNGKVAKDAVRALARAALSGRVG
ncbi:AMP-binding protein [Mycobacterium hodleri]|uniref:AMP-binding protein n=1 Tax=Mycolicibacterium hodleri TaxID=49897 RepID=UPI0021F31DEA|nr:AMP-binding protein [Mycolicibacterium hodleri]MCV7134983.1 AMP-binding protein [Mycolicibacterium hodleri]